MFAMSSNLPRNALTLVLGNWNPWALSNVFSYLSSAEVLICGSQFHLLLQSQNKAKYKLHIAPENQHPKMMVYSQVLGDINPLWLKLAGQNGAEKDGKGEKLCWVRKIEKVGFKAG